MIIHQVPAWVTATNSWVIADATRGRAVVVDVPPDPDTVGGYLDEIGVTVAGILLTHGHVDHVGGSADLARRTGAAVYVHPDDDFLTFDPASQLRILFGLVVPGVFAAPREVRSLEHAQRIDLAGFAIDVVHTPGHTPGHCCFHLPDDGVLFSGDQLFAGSIGRTDLPGGSFEQLMASMQARVMVLDDATRVLPGHGPETTIGRERQHNPFLVGLESFGTGHL